MGESSISSFYRASYISGSREIFFAEVAERRAEVGGIVGTPVGPAQAPTPHLDNRKRLSPLCFMTVRGGMRVGVRSNLATFLRRPMAEANE